MDGLGLDLFRLGKQLSNGKMANLCVCVSLSVCVCLCRSRFEVRVLIAEHQCTALDDIVSFFLVGLAESRDIFSRRVGVENCTKNK